MDDTLPLEQKRARTEHNAIYPIADSHQIQMRLADSDTLQSTIPTESDLH